MNITDADIARLRALCDGATPGPWDRALDLVPEGYALVAANEPTKSLLSLDPDDMAIFERPADAEFCAAAREWLPRLLDEVERLPETGRSFKIRQQLLRERDALRAEVERLRGLTATSVCVWCGHTTNSADSEARLSAIAEHIFACVNHPVGKALAAVAEAESERDEARAEVERLRADNRLLEDMTHDTITERNTIRAENEALKAELAVLRTTTAAEATIENRTMHAELLRLRAELARMGRAKPRKFRCVTCDCLWRLNDPTDVQPDGSWSLFGADQKPGPCCDNAPMTLVYQQEAKASGGGNG